MLPCGFRDEINSETVCLFGIPGKHITNDKICSSDCPYGNSSNPEGLSFFNICHFLDLRISISNETNQFLDIARCSKFGNQFNCSTCSEGLPIIFKGGISLGGINPHEFEYIRKKESLRKDLLSNLARRNNLMKKCFLTGSECSKNIELTKNSVFIAFRHTQANENVFKYALKPALDELGLTPIRALDFRFNIDFMCKICELIQKSEFVLADISEEKLISSDGVNSELDQFSKTAFNVGYELGIAHGLGKDTFIIRKEGTKEHQDLKRNESIIYTDDYDALKNDLIKMFTDTHNHTISTNKTIF